MKHAQLLLCLLGILGSTTFFNHVEARLEGEGIRGGNDAKEGQFPYQISLQVMGKRFCGGSILSERFVITAAHCVVNDDNHFMGYPLKVVAGTTDLNSRSKNRVAVDVIQVFVPSEYDAKKENEDERSTGDIAILKLKKNLDLKGNSKLGRVKLPKKGETYEGKKATISGFGWNSVTIALDLRTIALKEVNGKAYGKMRFAKANVLSYDDCQDIYSPEMPITKSHLCAALVQRDRGKPEGVCSGDSGGPLVSEGAQIGVVSSSPLGCNEGFMPAVYTRVSNYLDFIKKVVEGKIDRSIRTTVLRIFPKRWAYTKMSSARCYMINCNN